MSATELGDALRQGRVGLARATRAACRSGDASVDHVVAAPPLVEGAGRVSPAVVGTGFLFVGLQ